MRDGAKDIIERCIPRLFDSFKDRIQGRLFLNDHRRVMRLVDTIIRLQSVEAELYREFGPLINNTYANKMDALKLLCKEHLRSRKLRGEIEEELGLLIN